MRTAAGHQGKREIYEALKAQILEGIYGAGSLLPSSRALAAELGVARTTVSAAYDQLIAEGYVVARRGARLRVIISSSPDRSAHAPTAGPQPSLSAFGRMVAATPAASTPPRLAVRVDFHYGSLSAADFPRLAWRRAASRSLMQKKSVLRYDEAEGSLRLRKALQAYLWRSRSLRCNPDEIIIVNGSQQGIDLCARTLLDPHRAFVMENPGYAMARHALMATGASCIPVAVDEDGLQTDHLDSIAAQLAFTTPSHQYPLGGVMPIRRRQALLAWAERENAFVIEDDYDSEHRYDVQPLPPLHALDKGNRVIYLGTVSKTLAPAMRLGYLVVPPALAPVLRQAKNLTDRHAPLMEQEALAELVETGAYERHIRSQRRRNSLRRAALVSALQAEFGPAVEVQGADAGLHLVAWFRHFPVGMEGLLVSKAAMAGVGIYPLSPLHAEGTAMKGEKGTGFILGYGALEPERIREGVKLLAAAFTSITAQGPTLR